MVCDPRFTRTAAHATEYVRHRPGTDIPLVWGLLWHIFENGWEDQEFIRQRAWGMEWVREEVKKWTPEEVENVTGVPGAQLRRVAETLAKNKPATVIWCMGITQKHVGNANVRALCILQLALGDVGVAGGGTNIFRGHDNVQGATDMGVEPITLPAYYGLAEGAWKHWARVWDVPYDWVLGRFKDKKLMETAGIPLSRWADGVLEAKENVEQPDTLKAMIYWGHAPNSQTRQPDLKKAMDKLDLLVIIDPHPTVSAVLHDRTDGVYLLPAATQYETVGSVTASNRSLQWREKIFGPFFEAKTDHEIMYLFAKKFGFDKEFLKHIKIEGNEPSIEDMLRELNRGSWTIGYTGQSPERLKLHMANQATFDKVTLKASGGPCDGDYYGLPWPCWGTATMELPSGKKGHPGTPNLYDTSKHVQDGGLNFRALWGPTVKGQADDKFTRNDETLDNLLAVDSYPVGNELQAGHPAVTFGLLKKFGWEKDLTPEELETITKIGGEKIDAVAFQTDISGGIQRVAIKHGLAPFGNGKARCVVWNFPDPCRCTASRSTRRGAISWRSTPPTRIASSTACRRSTRASRSGTSPRSTRSSSPRGGWSSTRAAARSSAPTRGSPSCSRTCSWRSTQSTRTSSASRTASRSGSRVRRRARSRSWRWSPTASARASCSCPSTSAAISRARPQVEVPRRHRSHRSRRGRQHGDHVWL